MLLGAGAILLGTGVAPAFAADGPPVPSGCGFSQVGGVLTCVTTKTTTKRHGLHGKVLATSTSTSAVVVKVYERIGPGLVCVPRLSIGGLSRNASPLRTLHPG